MLQTQVQPANDAKFISFDQDWEAGALHHLPSYLAGNQRILAQQGIDGAIWAVSVQVASLMDSHKERASLDHADAVYFCNGTQGRSGPACWYEIEMDDGTEISTPEPSHQHQTGYYLGLFPQTSLSAGSLQVTISTMAPVQHMDRGPAQRPAAVMYQIQVANTGRNVESGRLRLRIRGETYIVHGGAEQWHRPRQSYQCEEDRPVLMLRSEGPLDLIFSPEEPATIVAQPQPGLSTHFELAPGETYSFHVWVMFDHGAGTGDTSGLSALSKAPAEHWMAATVAYWGKRLDAVSVSPPARVSDFLTRAAQECLYCIRVNDLGEVVGVVPSPVPVDERPLFSDILFVCMPALHLEPDLYARVIAWYAEQYAASERAHPLDTQARVIPAIMAGLLHRMAGSTAFLSHKPQTVTHIDRLLESVVECRDSTSGLFPTELTHGYQPLIQYELGTNIECWAAFHWWAQILDCLDMCEQATRWRTLAAETKESIRRSLATTGPGKGGWHYGGLRFVAEYRLDPLHYYEHDSLDIAIAPLLGFCSERHRPWLNTMEHMFSAFYELVQSRPSTAVWWEPAKVGVRREKHSSPSVVARLASVQDPEELDRAVLALERAIDVNGVLWFRSARGLDRVVRSGREMGAAYLVLVQRLLGLQIDAAQGKITYRPQNPWRVTHCERFIAEAGFISASQAVGRDKAQSLIVNGTARAWDVEVGFRFRKSSEVVRLWLDGQPYEHRATVEEDGYSRVFSVECELPPGAQVAVVIEVGTQSPPGFVEAASVA